MFVVDTYKIYTPSVSILSFGARFALSLGINQVNM
tara:strand:- start:507 stop:611 length:105 start_codon:yes stop_codon:yes gene_type:complete